MGTNLVRVSLVLEESEQIMNILFLTMVKITSLKKRGIYTDLMRKFRDEGHDVYIVTPSERREGKSTNLFEEEHSKILSVRTLNVQKTSIIEKGLGQVSIETLYKRAIHKYFKDVTFDLILYSTPPITLMGVVKDMKKKNPEAISYLLLKDIFPQNAVDIGMMPDSLKGKGIGLKAVISLGKYQLYKSFKKKEKELYEVSDFIGCMSPANVKYLLEHNPYIDKSRVEVAPNSLELRDECLESVDKIKVRKKYGLSVDKPIFIYGGNLGKPQDIPFLIKCLDEIKHRDDCHFIVVGTGTYLPMLQKWYNQDQNICVTVLKGLPKDDYDMLVRSCDVGLIFLDHRFTIPNYPSRLLSYLENKMPILCATDKNCDMGSIAEANGYGYWCESVNPKGFAALVDKMLTSDIKQMGQRGYDFLCKNYLVENTYEAIMKHFK